MKVYMAVTKDKYELPLAVFRTMEQLAEWAGVRLSTVSVCVKRAREDGRVRTQYREVEIDEN